MLNVGSEGSTDLSGYSVNGTPTPSSNNRNAFFISADTFLSIFFKKSVR